MITDIEDYFEKGCGRCPRFGTPECSTKPWSEGLRTLRSICLEAGLVETLKWAHPCYMYAGRNIAIIGAFRDNFRLSFFNAALMSDPDGVLERQGPNTQHPDMIRFTSNSQVVRQKPLIRSYLLEAMCYAEEGRLPPKAAASFELPEELVDALDSDDELADAFRALTPGRQRSYVLDLSRAKKPATRIARIKKFRAKIIAGKGATEYWPAPRS